MLQDLCTGFVAILLYRRLVFGSSIRIRREDPPVTPSMSCSRPLTTTLRLTPPGPCSMRSTVVFLPSLVVVVVTLTRWPLTTRVVEDVEIDLAPGMPPLRELLNVELRLLELLLLPLDWPRPWLNGDEENKGSFWKTEGTPKGDACGGV